MLNYSQTFRNLKLDIEFKSVAFWAKSNKFFLITFSRGPFNPIWTEIYIYLKWVNYQKLKNHCLKNGLLLFLVSLFCSIVDSWLQLRVFFKGCKEGFEGFFVFFSKANFLLDAATNACQTGPRTFGRRISLLSIAK